MNKSVFKKFLNLNTMGRLEGPPLAGVLVLTGAYLFSDNVTLNIWLSALAMMTICMNYVYLVNGVTDVDEDSINSPNRPLASGQVSLKSAWRYVNILFVLSLVYPFFLHDTWLQRINVWLILFMGVFYSIPPVRFKRFPPLATIYLTINFNLPLILGYQMASGKNDLPPYILATLFLFLANMPLKDYGDRRGDLEAGVSNWANLLGSPKYLLLLSMCLSILGTLISYLFLPSIEGRHIFVLLPLIPTLNILIHKVFKLNMEQMFTRGVRGLILICSILVAYFILK